MKLFFRYCLPGFSNCYVLGTEPDDYPPSNAGNGDETNPMEEPMPEALLVDPGMIDEEILNFIENNELNLRGVLITHDHKNHIRGLRTLKKIYDVDIYGMNQFIEDYETILLKDGDILHIGPFQVEVISIPGHSPDSAVFRIDNMLFTGDVLGAGLVGSTASSYGATTQMTALQSKLLSVPGDCIILPGHGPPSSLEAERRFNAGMQKFEQRKNPKQQFIQELFD